jgi:hypothetical protein
VRADPSKRSRRGPAPLEAEERRTHTVSVRLNAAELAQLDAQRATVSMQRGEYLRAGALHRLPPTIPALHREAWAELAREASNLNQLAKHLNQGAAGEGELAAQLLSALEMNRRLLVDVRRGLLGVPAALEDTDEADAG